MATKTKKHSARTRQPGSSRLSDGNVVVHTRASIEARADAVARHLGVDRATAFKMLDRGELRGTVAEMRLAPLRFLLD